MIRAHHALNPAHAVHSADVLSPPERYVQRLQHKVPRETSAPITTPVHWGDVPEIRAVLEQARWRR